MHNKGKNLCIYAHMRICAHIDIRVYAKYTHMIRVCVVHLNLSCTVAENSPKTPSPLTIPELKRWLSFRKDAKSSGTKQAFLKPCARLPLKRILKEIDFF